MRVSPSSWLILSRWKREKSKLSDLSLVLYIIRKASRRTSEGGKNAVKIEEKKPLLPFYSFSHL